MENQEEDSCNADTVDADEGHQRYRKKSSTESRPRQSPCQACDYYYHKGNHRGGERPGDSRAKPTQRRDRHSERDPGSSARER
jgi:hypothetical protein